MYTKLIESTKLESGGNEQSSDAPLSSSTASICNILAEAICSIDEDNKHTDAISALIQQARQSQLSSTSGVSADEDDIDGEIIGGLSLVSTVKVIAGCICVLFC